MTGNFKRRSGNGDAQAGGLHIPFERLCPLFGGKGLLDISTPAVFAVESDAAPAAGPADLCCNGAVSEGLVDKPFHMRGREVWRKLFLLGISSRKYAACLIPIARKKGEAQLERPITNAFENIEDL